MSNSAVVGILRALLTADTAQFQSGLKGAAKEARAWQKDFASIGQQATAAGRTLTAGLTLPILGVGTAAVKSFIDFEDSFAGVRKTVDASEPEFAAMAKQFRELAKTIPVNVNELNRLGESAGALGIPKQQVVEFARVMALLGVTTNLTSDQAAESIAKIQNIFGAAGVDTDRFAATLVALGNDGASTETQIVEMAARIAGAGNAVNMSQGQVLAYASALSSVGIEAEMGGSAISRVFINIASAVRKGGDEVKGFAQVANMSIGDFSKKFQTDAAGAVNEFIQGLNRVKSTGGDLIGTIEGLGFSEIRVRDTLLRAAGAGDILTKALNLQGKAWSDNTALTIEAEKRFATTKSQLILLWNNVRDLGIELGGALMPAFKSVIGVVKELLPYIEGATKWFGELPPWMQTTVVAALGLVAAVGPVSFLFGQMATGASTLIGLFTKKGIAMRAVGAAADYAVPFLTNFWRIAAGPVGWAVAAAAGFTWLGSKIRETAGISDDAAKRMSGGWASTIPIVGPAIGMYRTLGEDARETNQQVIDLTKGLKSHQTDGLLPTIDLTGKANELLAAQAKKLQEDENRTLQLTEAQKKHNEEVKALANKLSGGALQKDMDDLAEAVKGMGRAISSGELRELGPQLQDAANKGAQLDPVLEKIRLQAEANTKVWAYFTQLILANTAARKDAADRVEKYSDQEIKRVGEIMSARQKAMQQAQETAQGAADAVMRASMTSTEFALRQAARQRDESLLAIAPLKKGIPGVYEVARQNVLSVYDQMVVDAKTTSQKTMGAFSTAIANLPTVILGAVQGGGGVGKSIATTLGSALFGQGSGLNTLLNNGLSNLATKVGGGFAASLAGSISTALPGIGALLGPALASLGGKLLGALGVGANNTKKGREAIAKDLGYGSLAEFNQHLSTMGEDGRRLLNIGLNSMGKNDTAALQQWEKDVRKLFKTTEESAQAAAAETKRLNDELDGMKGELADLQAQSEPTWQDMLDDAKEFGIEISGLGPLFQQQRLDAEATKIWNALDTMKRGGADMTVVMTGLTDEFQAFILETLKFKTTIPENLKPYIEGLIATGQLVDENGDKLTDFSRINFGDPVKSKWEKIGESIDKLVLSIAELVKKLTGPVVDAAAEAKRAFDQWPTEWDIDVRMKGTGLDLPDGTVGEGGLRVPSFKKGTRGEYVDFGAGQLAMLHGRERVVTEGELMGAGGGGTPSRIDNVMVVDGMEFARSQFPYLVQVAKELGF